MPSTGRSTRSRRRPAPADRGAAAVEFALVSLVLFPLLLGIIQYGLFFADAINLRQGIRESARQGVVGTFAPAGTCTSFSGSMDKLRCSTKTTVGAFAGTTYVKTAYSASGWTKGASLKVCAMVSSSTPGMLPMPNGGWTRSQATMAIEQSTPAPTGGTSSQDSLPAGQDWTWCTAP